MTKERIVLAGGGSAGHVNPLLATATELAARGFEPVVLGTQEGLEADLVPAAGFELITVPKVPLPRRPSVHYLTLPGRLADAVRISTAAIVGARAMVGFGGYVAAPAYIGANRAKVPFVIHEQNVRPGLANRLGARTAAGVALTFSATALRATHGRTEVTGLPLRQTIATLVQQRATPQGALDARARAATAVGLDPALPTLLVTGGSLGAHHLNEVVARALPSFPSNAQILHLTGRGKSATLAHIDTPARLIVLEYLEAMEQALAVADLVLCRSGAGTVAELSALGLPAVFVPLPIGNGEQRLNGAGVVAAGGAVMVDDSEFSLMTMQQLVIPTLLDSAKLSRMSRSAMASSVGDGTMKVADMVEAVARR